MAVELKGQKQGEVRIPQCHGPHLEVKHQNDNKGVLGQLTQYTPYRLEIRGSNELQSQRCSPKSITKGHPRALNITSSRFWEHCCILAARHSS